MVHTCVVYGCTNRANDDIKRGFYAFPTIRLHEDKLTEDLSRERRTKWIAAVGIGRKDFTPSPYSKVCSDHFVEGKPAKLFQKSSPDWVPSLKLTGNKRKSKREQHIVAKRDQHLVARALMDLATSVPEDDVKLSEAYKPIQVVVMETNSNGCSLKEEPTVKRLKTTGTELEEFDAVFTDLVEGLVNQGKQHKEVSAAVDWFKEVCLYNVPFGKKTRGLTVVKTYKRINTNATESELRQARILGWCIEWLQAFFLVADDVMDKSFTRRGKPCWYKKEDVGLIAINDSFYLENCVYAILRRQFKQEDYYIDVVDLFHETTMQTVTGQCMDLITSPESRINFDEFTPDRYTAITKWKTAFYSFYLPVALAMYMAGIKDPATHEAAKAILLKMGIFFQIQDDYLDCYGDPEVIGKIGTDIQENKCSWLIVQALAKVTPEQRQILQENYGQPEEDKVLKVKAVYKALDLEQVYWDYEEESYRQLTKDIQSFQGQLPREVFTDFASKIYKRNK